MILILIILIFLFRSVFPIKDDSITKCCPENSIIKKNGCALDNTTKLLTLPVYKTDHVTRDDSRKINFTYFPVSCVDYQEENFLLVQEFDPDEGFFLQNDGLLWVLNLNASFGNKQFCLEYHEKLGIIAFICFPGFQDKKSVDEVSKILGWIGMIISLPFFLVTFIIYALLPERNLYTKCLMCYVFTLFWAYFLPVFSILYFQSGEGSILTGRIIIMSVYFFFMASFAWMNVIAMDIWLTFRGSRRILNNDKRGFLKYSLYAWGTPSVLILFVITMHYIVPSKSWYAPFNPTDVWFKVGYTELFYFYGPVGLLITINISLFVATSWKIIKTRKQTAVLRGEGSQLHNSEAAGRFKVYVKLMFAMGINWSVEIIQWAVKWKIGNFPFLWYLAEVCNAGIGVIIFFMFVCNKNTWRLLKKRYYMVTGKSDPTRISIQVQP